MINLKIPQCYIYSFIFTNKKKTKSRKMRNDIIDYLLTNEKLLKTKNTTRRGSANRVTTNSGNSFASNVFNFNSSPSKLNEK